MRKSEGVFDETLDEPLEYDAIVAKMKTSGDDWSIATSEDRTQALLVVRDGGVLPLLRVDVLDLMHALQRIAERMQDAPVGGNGDA